MAATFCIEELIFCIGLEKKRCCSSQRPGRLQIRWCYLKRNAILLPIYTDGNHQYAQTSKYMLPPIFTTKVICKTEMNILSKLIEILQSQQYNDIYIYIIDMFMELSLLLQTQRSFSY